MVSRLAPGTPPARPRGIYRLLVPLGLLALVLAAFWGVRGNGFIEDFDDDDYIIRNAQVQRGLSLQGIAWAFRTFHADNWHPLTWLSLQLDAQLFGPSPHGFHLTNLVLHAFNSLLLFAVLHRMTGALWRSATVAALFAVHPLHVESVAWAERKDVLSTLFWMSTLYAYARYTEAPARWAIRARPPPVRSRPPGETDARDPPFCLHRLPIASADTPRSPSEQPDPPLSGRQPWRLSGLLLEKLPLLILAAASCGATMAVQRRLIHSFVEYPFRERLANAIVAYVYYLGQTFWPAHLSFFYPHRGGQLPLWQVAGATALLAGISALALQQLRRRPYVAVGWFWYIGTLVPVIGLVQVGLQANADRYTYVPLVGVFIVLSWGVADLTYGRRAARFAVMAATATVIVTCVLLTRAQVGYWHDSRTLWQRAITVDPNNYLALNNQGMQLLREERWEDAERDFARAIRRAARRRGRALRPGRRPRKTGQASTRRRIVS